MKHYLILTLCLFSYSSSSQAAELEKVPLKPAGLISKKYLRQEFAKNCKSEREYPIFSDLSSPEAAIKINEVAHKILTVGKKLAAKECPPETGEGSDENYAYLNSYLIGKQVGSFLGMSFHIVAPGGSNRYIQDCRIFNLDTGEEFNVRQYFKQDSLKMLQQIMDGSLTSDPQFDKLNMIMEPEGLTQQTLKEPLSPFCLKKEGLVVLKSPKGKLTRSVLLSADTIKKMFQPNPLTDLMLPQSEKRLSIPVSDWPNMAIEKFGCYIEREFGVKPKKFNCDIKGYTPQKDVCADEKAYYEGLEFPEERVKVVSNSLKDIQIIFEHGNIQQVSFEFPLDVKKPDAINALKISRPLPKNIIKATYEKCSNTSNCLKLVGFEHLSREQANCKK